MATSISILAILLATSVSPAGASAPAAPPLNITGEYTPPASMMDGNEVVGREGEKIREMLQRSGISYKIGLLPWKRAYMMAQNDAFTCVYSTSRTAEREKQFKWVGPTDEAEWVLLGRADRKYQINSLEDARAMRIGTYNGDARDEYLRTRGFHVDPVPNDASNPKKLMIDRIDLWAVGARTGSTVLARFAPDIVPVLVFNRVKVYLACNNTVPDAMIERMNAALDTMRRDGSFVRLERKYEHWTERK
ncbi:substrate-binding periplasmic protein [Pseudoduganella sp. RAF53_2]|uniref:substrate-binding periplasmic protein n=1 Tax=unclassified Pseudoduganella TaxID=2637179 RepID=UPI003F9CA9F2